MTTVTRTFDEDTPKTESEHLADCKPRILAGPNSAMFSDLRDRLRADVDYGDWDGRGPDLMHHRAAAAIEDLLIALDSQIEICNGLRAQVEGRAVVVPKDTPGAESAVAKEELRAAVWQMYREWRGPRSGMQLSVSRSQEYTIKEFIAPIDAALQRAGKP